MCLMLVVHIHVKLVVKTISDTAQAPNVRVQASPNPVCFGPG